VASAGSAAGLGDAAGIGQAGGVVLAIGAASGAGSAAGAGAIFGWTAEPAPGEPWTPLVDGPEAWVLDTATIAPWSPQ
jgi:hypothetical protein